MGLLKVGFVGCGNHATMCIYPALRLACWNGQPIAGEQIAELVAVCDLKRELAERNARLFGVRAVYTDYAEMLKKEKLDVVFVVMHPEYQLPIAMDCLKAGKHVFIEKPPALSVEDAVKLREAAQEAQKFVMVGFNRRFSFPYLKAREITLSKDFGGPTVFDGKMTYERYPVERYDFLRDFAVHYFDLARFFMGEEVESVYAEHVNRGSGLDGYMILFKYKNGAIGSLNANCLEQMDNYTEMLNVSGEGSFVLVLSWRDLIYMVKGQSNPILWQPKVIPSDEWSSHAVLGYVGEVLHFLESIGNNTLPEPDISDGIKALQLVEACKESVRKKRSIVIEKV